MTTRRPPFFTTAAIESPGEQRAFGNPAAHETRAQRLAGDDYAKAFRGLD